MRNPQEQHSDTAVSTSPGLDFRVSQEAFQTTSDTLGDGVRLGSVLHAVEEVAGFAERSTAKYAANHGPTSPIQCRAGCAHCCQPRVHVTAAEVLLVAHHIDVHWSDDETDALKTRVRSADEVTRGLSDEDHGRKGIRCPLLVNERCSVYSARPLECRGYVSMDVEACEAATKNYDAWNVPLYFPQYSIFKNAQIGFLAALVQYGHDAELLGLIAALRIALESPNAVEDWLAGKDVFRSAALPDSDPEILALRPWTPTF